MKNQNSMLDIAFEIISGKTGPVDFYELYDEISVIKEFEEEEKKARKAGFYTDITLDGRFITTGENKWDLRSRHKYEEVHINMKDIYSDDETEEKDLEETDVDTMDLDPDYQNEEY